MKTNSLTQPQRAQAGFSLIITMTLMILLSLVAVGLLSLSTITLRASNADSAQAEAKANARLALNLAIAELQRTVGDDRRITANGAITGSTAQADAVGVWESWSPELDENPAGAAPDYENEKSNRFLRWLVSGVEEEVNQLAWAQEIADPARSINLFDQQSDGFQLSGNLIEIGTNNGSCAWAVSQENTKAKINISGPEQDQRIANDDLEVQSRPFLDGEFFQQPEGEWARRSATVLSLNQATLDPALAAVEGQTSGAADYTTSSLGLLTNVVKGGLKTDLSLGFELSQADFQRDSWGSGGETFQNPFRSAGETAFETPASYRGQRPLYRPLAPTGSFEKKETFWPANVQHDFPTSAVPTFDLLRSFYRIPYHLYQTANGLTVFEKESDHISAKPPSISRGYFQPPPASVEGERTEVGIRPVMDRVMFLISAGMSEASELRIVMTPVITLWNPYNVALEIEGAVAHAWLDLPYEFQWSTYNASGRRVSLEQMYTSGLMSEQFRGQGHGRSVNPYFYAAITATGEPLGATGAAPPIRFEPGEVRVFAPAERTLRDFNVLGSIRERTVFLRPVDNISQSSTRGGFSIPTRNAVRNEGFVRILTQEQTAQLTFYPITGEDYPFYISVEDATRAKGSNPTIADRGKAIADVLTNNFTQSAEAVRFESPRLTYARLRAEPVPIGVLESYHRVGTSGAGAQVADLVYTGNPRQPWMNPFITNTRFKAGPQYVNRMRPLTTFSGLIETGNGGRSAYYGPSQNAASGRTHLSFFEIPSAPLLSIASFQHSDLSATPFAPANQVANSWASAYVPRDRVSTGPLEVDHCYLLNEALWDGWFFSGAAASLSHSNNTGSQRVWNSPIARVDRSLDRVLQDFLESPEETPLRNPRIRLAKPANNPQDLIDELTAPEGCLKIAGELLLDGAFNVNSTSIPAWKAILGGLRGATFDVEGTPTSLDDDTSAFPRFREPVGEANDLWSGFRTLTDVEIESLATELVAEVIARGPFLSLAEFVNRRVASDDTGLRGALQEAIERAQLNQNALVDQFSITDYDAASRSNISPADTGVGIPGYLTQADVLKPLAPIITVRSDTFTIRSYGDSRSRGGKIQAQAWIEATVQRFPDFMNPINEAHTPMADLDAINLRFGRRLRITSLRYLSGAEANNNATS